MQKLLKLALRFRGFHIPNDVPYSDDVPRFLSKEF